MRTSRIKCKEDILKYVKVVNGCWEWQGGIRGSGYARMSREDGKQVYGHRLSYEIHIGEIPEGLFVLHTCDNPICVNPLHLWTGTAQDNTQDAKQKNRLSCGPGHNIPSRGKKLGPYPKWRVEKAANAVRNSPNLKRGLQHTNSVLTYHQVVEIRKRRRKNSVTYVAMAKEYGVCIDTVRRACRGTTYKDVEYNAVKKGTKLK